MASSVNPLHSNEALQKLMKELDSVSDEDTFLKWRSSFVENLESYLGDPSSIEKAREADAAVLAKMPQVDQAILKIEGCISIDTEGDNTPTLNEGVKSRMAANKLKEACQDMESRLVHLIPTDSGDIKKCGYTKWNLGAVLVKGGFLIYADMMHHAKVLPVLVVILEETGVDRQIIDAIQYYCKRIKACIAVLEDLGLLKILTATRLFVPDPKERPVSKLAEIEAKVVADAPEGSIPPDPILEATNARQDTLPGKLATPEKEQTINIVTKRRSTIRKSKSLDPNNDPPRVAKPKGKMVLPENTSNSGRGRGVGRSLSKEEARETKLPNPNAQKRSTPKRSKTMPNRPPKNDDEPPPESESDAPPPEELPKEKAAPPKKQASKQPGQQERRKTAPAPPAASPKKKTAPAPKPTQPEPDPKVQIVVLFEGRRAKLMVDLSKDTIGEIKKRLEKLANLPVEEQVLSANSTGTEFQDNTKTLASCDIKEGSELVLAIQEFDINVKVMPQGGKIVPLTVKPSTTCKMIKEQIAELSGIEVSKQELYFKKEELIERAKTVKQMGIKEGSTLVVDVELIVPITVQTMDKKTISLTVNLSNDVLADVKKKLEKDTGEHASNMKLLMPEDTELVEKKGKVFLRDYGIEEDSELFMEPKIIRISVELPDGKTSDLKVAPSSDMSIIIEAFVRTSTAAKKAKLRFEGKEFPKGVTVKGMGLLQGSLVKLELDNES